MPDSKRRPIVKIAALALESGLSDACNISGAEGQNFLHRVKERQKGGFDTRKNSRGEELKHDYRKAKS